MVFVFFQTESISKTQPLSGKIQATVLWDKEYIFMVDISLMHNTTLICRADSIWKMCNGIHFLFAEKCLRIHGWQDRGSFAECGFWIQRPSAFRSDNFLFPKLKRILRSGRGKCLNVLWGGRCKSSRAVFQWPNIRMWARRKLKKRTCEMTCMCAWTAKWIHVIACTLYDSELFP